MISALESELETIRMNLTELYHKQTIYSELLDESDSQGQVVLEEHLEDIETDIVATERAEQELTVRYFYAYAEWVYDLEAGGGIHYKQKGPSVPPSRILYVDHGNPVFLRDNNDRYSSYQYWMEFAEKPPEKCWVTCIELGVTAAVLDELYEIETAMMAISATEEMIHRRTAIRKSFRPV